MSETTMDDRDQDRLVLLDRLGERVPELDLDRESIEWTTLDDGHDALLVNGGGIDGGDGAYFGNCGDDVHAVGTLAPIVDGYVGVVDGYVRRHRDQAGRQPLPRPRGARPVGGVEAGAGY